jgi:Uri superfamily endonuclease
MTVTRKDVPGSLPEVPENRGLYLFLVRLHEPVRLKVGALGTFALEAGWYIYTGRARRNLVERVRRHFQTHKRVRWHIDRLIERREAEPLGAVVLGQREHPDWSECSLNQKVGRKLGAVAPVPGFGASDCSEGCPAHLWYVDKPLSLLQLACVSEKAALVLPRDGSSGDRPSPDWPLCLPRYFQVDTPKKPR